MDFLTEMKSKKPLFIDPSSPALLSPQVNDDNGGLKTHHYIDESSNDKMGKTDHHHSASSANSAILPTHDDNSSQSTTDATLVEITARPHTFSGAVLAQTHARDLSPILVLSMTHSLCGQALSQGENVNSSGTPRLTDSNLNTVGKGCALGVGYTVWITEAWTVLGWAEPSAAIFWEMASMYHTLHLVARNGVILNVDSELVTDGAIPPLLSCSSNVSEEGSGQHQRRKISLREPSSPGGSSVASGFSAVESCTGSNVSAFSSISVDKHNSNFLSSTRELPVWLIGTFLLLHCEERALRRSLSGKCGNVAPWMNPVLSPRTRINAEQYTSNTHCVAYLLCHLRKLLLFTAVPHNSEALSAIAALADGKFHHLESHFIDGSLPNVEDIRLQHHENHGDVGLTVRLTVEDIERLNLVLQAPSGGLIDDSPLCISDFLQFEDPITGSISVASAEQVLRGYLETGLTSDLGEGGVGVSVSRSIVPRSVGMRSSPPVKRGKGGSSDSSTDHADTDNINVPLSEKRETNKKELTYSGQRGKTILLQPLSQHDRTSGVETISGNTSVISGASATERMNYPNFGSARLHDLHVLDCSDAHIYLLQPFEHVTISACTGCTIVIGAVAGLLHVVDCERTTITVAARRVLIGNCLDVLHCVFTPSPPLLVGNNRSCQFAPYNTYYDGLREDLLVTGLAVEVVMLSNHPHPPLWEPPLKCATNKWKHMVELSKLEVPQVHHTQILTTGSSASGSDGNSSNISSNNNGSSKVVSSPDEPMQTPLRLPASEFHIIFVPLESEADRLRKLKESSENGGGSRDEDTPPQTVKIDSESLYCRHLAEVLQLSPFRLPVEYERQALVKAERMRSLQTTMVNDLTLEQQERLEEELNRLFRDWLAKSGNLRQVLDLVHLERKSAAS